MSRFYCWAARPADRTQPTRGRPAPHMRMRYARATARARARMSMAGRPIRSIDRDRSAPRRRRAQIKSARYIELGLASLLKRTAMVKNTWSRVFHSSMVVACAIICLFAIISFSSFASEHQKIRRKYHGHDKHCILFTDSSKENRSTVLLSNSHPCMFAIWGEVSVFLLALILGVLFVVKNLMAANA